MAPLRISAVSYLNTFPFVYGILQSDLLHDFHLELDVPSVCAAKLKRGDVDVALVPAGAIPDFTRPEIIPGFCIGSVRNVNTVLLLSQVPLSQISCIHLDFDSRTSVKLVRVLSSKFWKINPEFISLEPGRLDRPELLISVVAIGDKTFSLAGRYKYVYDLAAEWIRFTSLPFVFAVWMSNGKQTGDRIQALKDALAWGVARKNDTVEFFKDKLPQGTDSLKYLEENISYELDEPKKAGLNLFLKYLSELG